MGMYKRGGDRVLINTLGDIRVRPTIFEVNLHGAGYSVKQHFLVSYLDALGSIMIAQLFKYKYVFTFLSPALPFSPLLPPVTPPSHPTLPHPSGWRNVQ